MEDFKRNMMVQLQKKGVLASMNQKPDEIGVFEWQLDYSEES